jgi:hypothetical protein
MLYMLKSRLCAGVTLLMLALGAHAAPVNYRFTGDIAGTLNGSAVVGALDLNVSGDTDDITHPSQAYFLNTLGGAVFSLAGVGSFTVTNSAYVFARPDLGVVGFGVQGLTNCCDIIQILNPAFAGYDLHSDIGPLGIPGNPGNPSLADWVNVPTTAGLFTVTSMRNNTFQATVTSAVPEPGMPALLVLAGVAAGFAGRRRGLTALLPRGPAT